MQALVIAHACYRSQLVLQGQLPVQTWTDASAIVTILLFAKGYVADASNAMALKSRSVTRFLPRADELWRRQLRAPSPISAEEERERQREREEYLQHRSTICGEPIPKSRRSDAEDRRFPAEPQENYALLSSRRTRRCLSRGNASLFESSARSRSIFTRSANQSHERGLGDILALHHSQHTA